MAQYTERNIVSLSLIDGIRLRPAMYVDGIGEHGLYKIDSEPLQNILDERSGGYGDHCNIHYETDRGYMRFEDNARGIPIGVLEPIFTSGHTGGKFNNDSYEYHAGQNGIGLKATNALSKWLKAEVYRKSYIDDVTGEHVPAKHAIIEFEKGIKKNLIVEDLDIPKEEERSGTTIEYVSDDSILKTNKRDIPRFKDYLNISAYSNPGFVIDYYVDGKKTTFMRTGGLSKLFEDFVKDKKLKTLIDTVEIFGKDDICEFNIWAAYSTSNSGDSNIISIVNGNRTPCHGTHVSAFKTGFSSALSQYIVRSDAIPKSNKNLKVTGSIISDNIIAVVGLKHKDPMYNGQTKEALKSVDIENIIRDTTKNIFSKWLNDNPKQAEKIIDLAISYAKYEEERKKLKQNIMQTKQVKSAFSANGVDPSKFTSCRSTNPEERELFIVEGDSAGGSASKELDRQYQAMYKLTGKTLNIAKNTSKLSKVLLDLIQILGMGLPGQTNIKNLQYSKVIIMTDADDDGAHITTLLLAFFFILSTDMIKMGKVYIARPPLKAIVTPKSKIYVQTEDDYNRIMSEFIVNSFDLYSVKNNTKLSQGLFKAFIFACDGYDTIIENYMKPMSIDADLLELIVIYINDLLSGNYEEFNKNGYKVTRNGNHFNFDSGYKHMFVDIDKSFIENAYDEIFKALSKIEIYGVYMKGIRSGIEYRGTIYKLMRIMKGVLGPKVNIIRFKGLGEMDPNELGETAINPTTRMLTRVNMSDYERCKQAMDIFMAGTDKESKAKFYAGELNFDD